MTTPFDVGSSIPTTEKVVYQRALARQTFSADSIHNDDYTKQQGYPGALVSAYVLAGLMSEPVVDLFGASWYTTGKISLTFIGKGLQQGDRVTRHGTVTAVEPLPAGGRRVSLEIWMEKQGKKVVVGEASAVVDAPSAV